MVPPKPVFPWSAGSQLKRKAEEMSLQEPSPKKAKLSPLDKLLQNQKDFQLLMAKQQLMMTQQQNAFQQQLMGMIGQQAIAEWRF